MMTEQLPGMGATRARAHLTNLRNAAAYFAERGYGTDELLRMYSETFTDAFLADLDVSTDVSSHGHVSRDVQLHEEERAAIAEITRQSTATAERLKPPRFTE